MMEKNIKTYHEAVDFIESLANVSATEGMARKRAEEHVKRVRDFLRFLGSPEKKLKIIHIAGTSGKGSVANMVQNILSFAGYKAGLYTSPHTTTYCERIKIGDKYISERDLVELTNFLADKMDEFVSKFKAQISKFKSLNFFEFTFVLALLYFKKTKCDYAVIETGLGGRRDTTNAIQKPIYTIITNIGRDHLDVIGPTVKDVAREKAGIIKKGIPFLTGEKRKKLLEIFKKRAELLHCYIVKLLDYKELRNIKTNLDGTSFKYNNESYKLRLLGEHQAKNAALAIECANDLKISTRAIKKGLFKTQYPARLEVVSKKPLIIIDGAHNTDKLRTTMQFIRKFKVQSSRPPRKRERCGQAKFKSCLIIAAAKNKEIDKVFSEFAEYFDKIYLTRFRNPFRRCRGLSDWSKIIPRGAQKKIKYFHLAKDALLDILPRMRNNDLLVISGSIFLAGELREYWYPSEKIVKFRRSLF